jgi:GxxExxY protein
MRQAIDVHSEMGNLWDEQDYRQQLAIKCRKIGLDVFEEVCICITHNSFTKKYFIDLLINGSIYELKTAAAIARNHENQQFIALSANTALYISGLSAKKTISGATCKNIYIDLSISSYYGLTLIKTTLNSPVFMILPKNHSA